MALIDLVVTNANDAGEGSLRAALAEAQGAAADDLIRINFDQGLAGQTIFLQSPLAYGGPRAIVFGLTDEDGAPAITISGDSDQDGLVTNADSGLLVVSEGGDLRLQNVVLADGGANGAVGSIAPLASAIYNDGSLTLANAVVTGMEVRGGFGAAASQTFAVTLYNDADAVLTLTDVQFLDLLSVGQSGENFGGAIAGIANLGTIRLDEVGFAGQAFGADVPSGTGGPAGIGIATDDGGTLEPFFNRGAIRMGVADDAVVVGGAGPDVNGSTFFGVGDPESSPLQIGVAGTDEDDVLELQRPDALLGFGGDDVLRSITGPAHLMGGRGDDILTLDGGAGGEDGDGGFMDGGPGNDMLIIARPGATVHGDLQGGEGSDTGTDTISFRLFQFGGVTFDLGLSRALELTEQEVQPGFTVRAARIENVEGTFFDDTLIASEFNSTGRGSGMFGLAGDDTLTGNAAADELRGGDGDDSLLGAGGNDILEGGAGADDVNGGDDRDLASYASSRGAVTIDLVRGVARGGHAAGDVLTDIEDLEGGRKGDRLSGDAGDNSLSGGRGKDLLVGRNGADAISGDGGNDDLRGGGGADSLVGGGGADRLDGGAADDVLTGGAGRDVFVLGRGDGRRDVITDWNRRQDTIEFESGVRRFEQLKIVDRGDDVLIKYRRDGVLVEDAEVDDFRARDFDFG